MVYIEVLFILFMQTTHKDKLVAVPERLLPFLTQLQLLDEESLQQVMGWILVERESTHERYMINKRQTQ